VRPEQRHRAALAVVPQQLRTEALGKSLRLCWLLEQPRVREPRGQARKDAPAEKEAPTKLLRVPGPKGTDAIPVYSAPMTRPCQAHDTFGSLLAIVLAPSRYRIRALVRDCVSQLVSYRLGTRTAQSHSCRAYVDERSTSRALYTHSSCPPSMPPPKGFRPDTRISHGRCVQALSHLLFTCFAWNSSSPILRVDGFRACATSKLIVRQLEFPGSRTLIRPILPGSQSLGLSSIWSDRQRAGSDRRYAVKALRIGVYRGH
jgi:hypothetical protein